MIHSPGLRLSMFLNAPDFVWRAFTMLPRLIDDRRSQQLGRIELAHGETIEPRPLSAGVAPEAARACRSRASHRRGPSRLTVRELTIRYTMKTDAAGEPIVVGLKVSTSVDCAAVFTTVLQDQASEVFAILCLSTRHRVPAYHEVGRGCLDSSSVLRSSSFAFVGFSTTLNMGGVSFTRSPNRVVCVELTRRIRRLSSFSRSTTFGYISTRLASPSRLLLLNDKDAA